MGVLYETLGFMLYYRTKQEMLTIKQNMSIMIVTIRNFNEIIAYKISGLLYFLICAIFYLVH